ncbi:MAG TPA: SRPBCC family protein [Jiangellaceae bacterium]|nr:SRPBCC family protein [Jiangellaceae bacterium]
MVANTITREILIDAPLDVVWSVVTDPVHVGSWFGDSASIDLQPGGEAVFTWDAHGAVRARIERVEPPHYFAFSWARRVGVEPAEGESTLVEFTLSKDDDRTRLQVVESGFDELALPETERAKHFGENSQGWDLELAELRAYIAGLMAR